MKLLWLTCLCCASAWALAACGDDDGGGGSDEDGGVTPTDLNEVNERIDGVDDALNELAGDLDDLSGNVSDLSGEFDGLGADVDDLDSRVAGLENPDPISCSEVEQCIPDGIMLVSAGLEEIIARLCELEINCCTEDELNYKFGPGIATVAECTETFVDLVNNGFVPDFLYDNGVIIQTVISMAQALNDTRVRVEINNVAVGECLEWLDARECDQYSPPPTGDPEHCSGYEPAVFPCDPWLMLTGQQEAGELCGLTDFDECGEDLACRGGIGPNGEGLCAPLAVAGDRCTHDTQCDPHETDLFCNLSTGECQERGDAGDDCAYVDPSFTATNGELNPNVLATGLQNPSALALECKHGLTCDPVTHECVPICSNGSVCYAGYFANLDCPDGQTCNATETPGLWNLWFLGVCRAPIADDQPCTLPSECASGRCEAFECVPALKAEGEACALGVMGVSQVDASCASGFCAADSPTVMTGTCARLCLQQADCEATDYCDIDTDVSPDPQTGLMRHPCEVKRPDAASCEGDPPDPSDPAGAWNDPECASGFCNDSLVAPVCQAKAAAGGACASAQDAECPNTQYCNAATCADFLATDATCTQHPDCGPGNYCFNTGAGLVCKPYGEIGDDCSTLACSPFVADLDCVAIGSASQCHVAGEYPTGATCTGSDELCASGWCRMSDNTCQPALAVGEACDTAMLAINRCAEGAFCKYALNEPGITAGECAARGTAGQACDPRYLSADCLNTAPCLLQNDAFVCAVGAVPPETLFCDGT